MMAEEQGTTEVQGSRIERFFGDLETFDIILARVLWKWGGQGAVIPRDHPRYLFDDPSTFAPLCSLIRSLDGGEELCWICDLEHAEEAAQVGQPIDYVCDNGLLDVAVPIVVRGQSIATIIFGQRRVFEDPDYEAVATAKLRRAEERLNISPGTLQEAWEKVDTVTRAEVEQAKSDVDRIASFVAEILAENEELQIKTERSVKLEEELGRLSLTNLLHTDPLKGSWQVLRGVFVNMCRVLNAQSGIVLREHPGRKDTLIIWAQYPSAGKQLKHLYPVPGSRWKKLIDAGLSITTDADEFDSQYGFLQLATESTLTSPERAETVVVPVRIDRIQNSGFAMLFSSQSPPDIDELEPWLPFHLQLDLFEMVASRLEVSYSAIVRYHERLVYEEARRQYVQDTTHQLVGPLSGLRAHCENLLRGRLPVERGRKVLETLVEQAGLLQRYAENFGLAARIGKSMFDPSEYRPEVCKPRQLVEILVKCAKSFQGLAKSKDLRGPSVDEVSFRGFPPLILDMQLFEVLILNLYDNAIKYSYESSPITVAGRVLNGKAEIEVTNHGIPLNPDEVDMIFEQYTRSPEAEEFAPVGTGIGLYICTQIAKLHKWSIRALPSRRSRYGNEVKFIITVPVGKHQRQ